MTAKLLVLYRPPADAAAFDAYYATTHVPIAKKIPGLRGYELARRRPRGSAATRATGSSRRSRSTRWPR